MAGQQLGLVDACRKLGIAKSTFQGWMLADPTGGLADKYRLEAQALDRASRGLPYKFRNPISGLEPVQPQQSAASRQSVGAQDLRVTVSIALTATGLAKFTRFFGTLDVSDMPAGQFADAAAAVRGLRLTTK